LTAATRSVEAIEHAANTIAATANSHPPFRDSRSAVNPAKIAAAVNEIGHHHPTGIGRNRLRRISGFEIEGQIGWLRLYLASPPARFPAIAALGRGLMTTQMVIAR